MDKNPITKLPEIEETEKHKSKHKKRETLCKDKRRAYFSCGVCGSEDLIDQGIKFCNNCNIEQEFLSIDLFRKFGMRFLPCECNTKHKNYYSIKKCITCGAVEARTCPACGGYCWTSIYGEKYCKRCSFRFEGYKKK